MANNLVSKLVSLVSLVVVGIGALGACSASDGADDMTDTVSDEDALRFKLYPVANVKCAPREQIWFIGGKTEIDCYVYASIGDKNVVKRGKVVGNEETYSDPQYAGKTWDAKGAASRFCKSDNFIGYRHNFSKTTKVVLEPAVYSTIGLGEIRPERSVLVTKTTGYMEVDCYRQGGPKIVIK